MANILALSLIILRKICLIDIFYNSTNILYILYFLDLAMLLFSISDKLKLNTFSYIFAFQSVPSRNVCHNKM